jgi:hypothetical protein
MSDNPAIQRQPSGDVDIALPDEPTRYATTAYGSNEPPRAVSITEAGDALGAADAPR